LLTIYEEGFACPAVAPVPPPCHRHRIGDRRPRSGVRLVDFTGDYELPGEQGVLKLGYKMASHKNDFDVRYTNIDPVTLAHTANKDSGLISERKVFISDTVLLTTRDNAGSNHAGGLEFTASGKILPQLTINTSANLGYNEQRICSAATASYGTRGAQSLGGRARFNYQLSEQDQVQVSLNARGRSLSGLGYRQPDSTAKVNFRHALTPMLNLVVNLTDVFNTNRIETFTDTDLLKETNLRRYDSRGIYVGLSCRLGDMAPAPARRTPPVAG
jgi:hypothetical protein